MHVARVNTPSLIVYFHLMQLCYIIDPAGFFYVQGYEER